MSSALVFALTLLLADGDEPKYAFALKKPQDSMEARKEEKRTGLVITSQSGIGEGGVLLTEGRWPRDIVLRFQYDKTRGFKMLESFTLTTNRIHVSGSQRTSGKMALYFLSPEGKPGDVAGQVNVTVAEKDGALELTLPAHLLTGAKEVRLKWIDAFRR
jgi:hypothetical protein